MFYTYIGLTSFHAVSLDVVSGFTNFGFACEFVKVFDDGIHVLFIIGLISIARKYITCSLRNPVPPSHIQRDILFRTDSTFFALMHNVMKLITVFTLFGFFFFPGLY